MKDPLQLLQVITYFNNCLMRLDGISEESKYNMMKRWGTNKLPEYQQEKVHQRTVSLHERRES